MPTAKLVENKKITTGSTVLGLRPTFAGLILSIPFAICTQGTQPVPCTDGKGVKLWVARNAVIVQVDVPGGGVIVFYSPTVPHEIPLPVLIVFQEFGVLNIPLQTVPALSVHEGWLKSHFKGVLFPIEQAKSEVQMGMSGK